MDLTRDGKSKALALAISMLSAGAAVACSGGDAPRSRPAVTQRQRDSALAASRLPGAQGVAGALRAADSARARRAAEDSIIN